VAAVLPLVATGLLAFALGDVAELAALLVLLALIGLFTAH
jgi:hypothetical protein